MSWNETMEDAMGWGSDEDWYWDEKECDRSCGVDTRESDEAEPEQWTRLRPWFLYAGSASQEWLDWAEMEAYWEETGEEGER